MSREPVNIAGVCAFPNENGGRNIRFIDTSYKTLFHVPDHGAVTLTRTDGTQQTLACHYIDDTHAYIGGRAYHIMEFAEMVRRNGYTCQPEQSPHQKQPKQKHRHELER